MMATANACTFCKKRKRKCDKTRPACSNCTRLRKICEYSEDAIRTPFPSKAETNNARPDTALPAFNPYNSTTFPRAVLDFSMSVLGSYENLHAITNEFFITTHQRIPILSRHRFYSCILEVSSVPRADLAALSLCIYLIQQMPGETTSKNMRSSLYVHVKSLIGLLEMADNFTIDLLHCKILLIYYELGHGFHTSAYLSLAAAAKMARIMGIHEKPWQTKAGQGLESTFLEEQKRAWWAIVNLDRFISLCHGETLLATEDPEISDILPIEDLLWSEGSQEELAELIAAAPSLDTPSNVTLGQMARECQISHIIGRLTRHMSNPTLDPEFNREECNQLERTLRAYVPLLAEEELKMGKYCGAFAMCNNALFILYEFKLNKSDEANYEERWRILQSMEDVSLRSIAFAELSFSERIGSTLYEVHSPYCPYSLFQAAVVQYRLWKQTNDLDCKLRVDSLKSILQEFAKRWSDSSRYLDALEKLEGDWPPMTVLPQRAFH